MIRLKLIRVNEGYPDGAVGDSHGVSAWKQLKLAQPFGIIRDFKSEICGVEQANIVIWILTRRTW